MDIKLFQRRLENWYKSNKRDLPWRRTTNPYLIWISEVMLQQTQVDTVIPYYQRFIKRFPTPDSLATAPMEEVLKIWEGLGYYARARNLQKAARIVVSSYDARIPEDYTVFLQLPGVGPYIAAAVQSIAFNHPVAAVDGNVKRVLARLFENHTPINTPSAHNVFGDFAQTLLHTNAPSDHNQGMMELGALICTPKSPSCPNCPVNGCCAAFNHNTVSQYPRKKVKAPVPIYPIAVGIIQKGKKVLITQRPPEGLLGGLWEFPGGKKEFRETSEAACLREIREEVNLNASVYCHLTTVKHAYSHFKINMDVFICNYVGGRVKRNSAVAHKWVTIKDLSQFPFPKANTKFFPLLANHPRFR